MMLNFKAEGEYFLDAVGRSKSVIKDSDIAVSCPICGDSKHGNKRRLHFYQKDNKALVNCFNDGCSVNNMSLYRFLKTYFPNVFNRYNDYRRRYYLNELIFDKQRESIPKTLSADNNLRRLFEEERNTDAGKVEAYHKIFDYIGSFEKEDFRKDFEKFIEFSKSLSPHEMELFKRILRS